MKFLLDTNTCIRHLNQRSPQISHHLLATPESDITLCSIVKAELYTGALKSQQPQTTLAKQRVFTSRFVSLPFDDHAADVYAGIRSALEKSGTPVGNNDMMIAAIALIHNLTLITHNLREFSRIPNLLIEDWELS
ncbi:MAG: type II toxin-antitoxin system VapC family toxin [Anaerolineae bacterium]|nr:type II toxin-antitoxin system VapC family toxin [Anaerolineae bacterium]